jgi:hypothetical protein
MRESTKNGGMKREMLEKIRWKAQWRIDKFKDPTGEVARALQNGMSIAEAKKRFSKQFIKTDLMKPDFGELQFMTRRRAAKERRIALNEGLGELIDIICGLGTPTKWDSGNARLGVGDSNAAESATQTGLQAATNKTFKAMDATYPQRSAQTAEWRSTFGSADANYAWEEYTVVNAADDSGKNLNRKIASKGTKASGESWVLSLKITFS